MFSRTVQYNDFNGDSHTEVLYFHISSPEMMDLQFNPMVDGDMAEFVKSGIRSGKGRQLWIIFKLLVVNSYGRRSEDGAKFTKKAEFTEEFMNSPAWEKFFEWLLLDSPDGKHASEFYNAIMPERFRDENELKKLEAATSVKKKKKLHELSRDELQALYLERLREDGPKEIED